MNLSAKDIEYLIRMYQRGIRVAVKTNLLLADEPASAFIATNRSIILRYAHTVTELKKMLLKKTGRCSPQTPPWPL